MVVFTKYREAHTTGESDMEPNKPTERGHGGSSAVLVAGRHTGAKAPNSDSRDNRGTDAMRSLIDTISAN